MKKVRSVKKETHSDSSPFGHESTKKTSFVGKVGSWAVMLVFIVISFLLGNFVGNLFMSQRSDLGAKFKNIVDSSPFAKVFSPSDTAPASESATSQNAPPGPPTKMKIAGTEVTVPGPTSSKEEQEAFMKVVVSAAKDATTVEIVQGCAISPEVPRVPEGSTLTIVNKEAAEHTLAFGDANQTVKIAAGGNAQFKATLKGQGIYAIICDNKNVAGHLQVVQAE